MSYLHWKSKPENAWGQELFSAPSTTGVCICLVSLVIVMSHRLLDLDRASSCLLRHLHFLSTKLLRPIFLAEACFVPAQSVAQSFIKTWHLIFWCVADMDLAQLHLQETLTDSHMVMKTMADTGIQQSCPLLCSHAAGVMSTGESFAQCVHSCTAS